jgi:hypothetical protein
MIDELETRLHAAFRSGTLPTAPARLLEHLEEVLSAPVVRAEGRDGVARGGRRPWGALAVAAVLLVGGAIAVSVGSRGPSPMPSASPSALVAEPPIGRPIRLAYAPQWTADVPFDAGVLAATVAIVQQRIDATGLVGAQVGTEDQGRIVADLPAGIDPDPIRRLVGQAGQLAFVPVGDTIVERGTHLDPAAFPALLGSSDLAGASVDNDGTGQPTLQIALTSSGGKKFGDYTAAHIGSYFAIVLDGTVIAAPVINEAIPGGSVQISFPTTETDRTELAQLATIIRLGPLPVLLVEIATGPAPSATLLAADEPLKCGPQIDVAGDQLGCGQAAFAALKLLPVGHPAIKEISFTHGCPEAPGRIIDCATQMFGIVTINFNDDTPAVRILVDIDLKASYLPGSSSPGATASFNLNLNTDDFGCDTIRTAYRSVVITIDPSAGDPVRALADTGQVLQTFWSASFRGGTNADPVVYDGQGVVVAGDGTTIDLLDQDFPTLAGYFVCPSADEIRVFDRAP